MTAKKTPKRQLPKVAPEPVPKNPDQKLATRGYVKCLARKIQDHRHWNAVGEGMVWYAVAVLISFFSMALVSLMIWNDHMTTMNIVLISIGWSIVVNSVVLFVVLWTINQDKSGQPSNTPDEIAAYTPPKERSKYDQDRYCGED